MTASNHQESSRAAFERDGFLLMKDMLSSAEVMELETEIDRELAAAFGEKLLSTPKLRAINGHYLPLLRPGCAFSRRLVEDPRLVGTAELLMGDHVFLDPVSAGAVSFYGEASWHRDADLDVPGIKFVSYLDILRPGAGALHLATGSHRASRVTLDGSSDGFDLEEQEEVVIGMRPGDNLAFDLRTWHANPHSVRRRQWTAVYLRMPRDEPERQAITAWLAEGESYETVEPLPDGIRWLDPEWVNDPGASATKLEWLSDLARLGRTLPR
jgi:hypothetical protein